MFSNKCFKCFFKIQINVSNPNYSWFIYFKAAPDPTPWACFAHWLRLRNHFPQWSQTKLHFISWNSSQMLTQRLLYAKVSRRPCGAPNPTTWPRFTRWSMRSACWFGFAAIFKIILPSLSTQCTCHCWTTEATMTRLDFMPHSLQGLKYF